MIRLLLILTFFCSPGLAWSDSSTQVPQLQTYITASQVEKYFSTEEARQKTLQVYQQIGIKKAYLDTLRTGVIPSTQLLIQARDFLLQNGIEAAGGITTTAGGDFGTASTTNRYWLNYQDPKTQQDMAAHVRRIAPLFDEIMIDDFLATDDTSEESIQAKGKMTWSKYRLQLMSDFARNYILQPARDANPHIRFIEKFPQWYDRFHLFGYNVVDGPKLFDRIWVGTETRNPSTKRFGFVMPTQGYINYRWLASIAKDKIGGAWFDFGDCVPLPYKMQAYQSVLAGAQEIVLFETGSLIEHNPCIDPLLERRDALYALGDIIKNQKSIGMYAYKPPHSDGSDAQGSANLYIYDYLATLGLAPLPVIDVPPGAKSIFLARQAADDPQIKQKMSHWFDSGIQLLVTTDFLRTIDHPRFKPIDMPTDNPVFTHEIIDSNTLYILNLKTFGHNEFAPGKEMFLPPKPLPVRNWPDQQVNQIRKAILSTFGIEFTAPNNVGIYLFDDVIVLANFNDVKVSVELASLDKRNLHMHKNFPHDAQTTFESHAQTCKGSISPWELAVIQRKN